jgi:hypothetical protein
MPSVGSALQRARVWAGSSRCATRTDLEQFESSMRAVHTLLLCRCRCSLNYSCQGFAAADGVYGGGGGVPETGFEAWKGNTDRSGKRSDAV